VLRVGRHGGDDEADRRGSRGGDRGRRRRHRAAHTRRRGGFWQICQGRAGRDGPSARAAARGAERANMSEPGAGGPNSEEKFFSNKNWIFEFTKTLEICRRRFRRNFDMRIFLNSSRLLKDFRKI
jgi:hypothetical protein